VFAAEEARQGGGSLPGSRVRSVHASAIVGFAFRLGLIAWLVR
jgi:hypothetical protein